MNEALTTRDHSYRVRRSIPVGSRVVLLEDQGHLDADTEVTIHSYSNAGFQGIEATVQLDDGTFVHGISAGILASL